jgi:hypothetical protein
VRLEIDKLRLATQQLAFAKLLEARIREYPSLYAMLSDLSKALDQPSTVSIELAQLLGKVNEWDSQHAVFLDPKTSNKCNAFRQALLQAVREMPAKGSPITTRLLETAKSLKLALRSDLGIHGFRIAGRDVTPGEQEDW